MNDTLIQRGKLSKRLASPKITLLKGHLQVKIGGSTRFASSAFATWDISLE